ncbi:MAG: capsular polysaccharide biosynthesis protein [Ruminococcus sp.]|nr:capsular polysaccharide biosynthesis protein [Ruminococcus sp.]
MLTDLHCHILPGIDDGARDREVSLQMLGMMKEQGVERVVATPHFYAHREKSVGEFLEKRRAAYESVAESSPLPVILGAEVAIEHGISELPGIEKLAFEGTRLILLELPYRGFESWMAGEIEAVSSEYRLKVILAHVHRYLSYYSKEEIELVLGLDVIPQINNEAFTTFKERRFVKRLMKEGRELAFGSDAHNITDRRPNWDVLRKKTEKGTTEFSDSLANKFRR